METTGQFRPVTWTCSSSSSSGGGGPGGVRGPLGAGLGGLPLYWSSFSHSSITEHRSFSTGLVFWMFRYQWNWVSVSAPCLVVLLGPPGCWGGGGGGGGDEPWSCPCDRSAVPYTATVRLVYQPRSTKPSVFTCMQRAHNYLINDTINLKSLMWSQIFTFPLGLNTMDLFSSYSRLGAER